MVILWYSWKYTGLPYKLNTDIHFSTIYIKVAKVLPLDSTVLWWITVLFCKEPRRLSDGNTMAHVKKMTKKCVKYHGISHKSMEKVLTKSTGKYHVSVI